MDYKLCLCLALARYRRVYASGTNYLNGPKPHFIGCDKIFFLIVGYINRHLRFYIQGLNVKPQMSVYIADNEEKDFIAPNKMGFWTVQIIRPARIHTSVSGQGQAKAQFVIHKISELPALLEKL